MKKNFIHNWGNYPVIQAEIHSQAHEADIQALVKGQDSLLARGNGRCYGDAALNPVLFSSHRMNKLLAFDREKGILSCEAGVLLSDILDVIVPAGFFLPVTPGTKFISVGGAIAADVHGKNHHAEGCFSDHLLSFDLINHQGETIHCTPATTPGLFWQTAGGMGLTGIIVRATFQLKPIETAFIRQESIKARNLQEIMDLFEASENWTYTMSWIDCLQKGNQIGRSILMRGEHALTGELPSKAGEAPLALPAKGKLNIPFNFPNFALNPLSIKAFNFLYYRKQFAKQVDSIIPYDTFFYPLDAIHNWNRMYGKNGFTQYQFVIPKAAGRAGMSAILKRIADSGQGSFLAVLKLFGKNNPLAINSFPMEGYTLALDFKINDSLKKLIPILDDMVAELGGRIYLAKDAFSTRHGLPQSPIFINKGKFNSLQQDRIRPAHKSGSTPDGQANIMQQA